MKRKSARYDNRECEVCNSRTRAKRISQDFWIRGQLIVVENVPAGVCPQCSEKVVNAVVGRRLAELVCDKQQIADADYIKVPALAYH